MSIYTNNDITFNNVKTTGLKLSSNPILINGLIGTDPEDNTGIINAVDIDWNDADLESLITNDYVKSNVSNLRINTTGDLLKLIIELSNLIKEEKINNYYYLSIGINPINENNYKYVNNSIQILEYNDKYEYIVNERSYVYMLVSENKTINFIEPTLNSIIDLVEENVNINGYKVYRSSIKLFGKIIIKVFDKNIKESNYYSIGTDEITEYNYKTVNNAVNIIDDYPNNTEYIIENRSYLYILVADNKHVTLLDNVFNMPIDISIINNVYIPNHKIYKSDIKISGKVYIEIS